jgi:DNA-binding IclR family transcriptional regulator
MAAGVAQRQGIQSIEIGFGLLQALAMGNRAMMLRDIAKAAGMPSAKAHRYMVSFLRLGLVEQDRSSGRYDLGTQVLRLGLAGLARIDPVRFAGPILEDLCDTIHGTVALAVWGSQGPTIVRIVDAGGPVTVTLRHGAVLPLFKSATGRAFAAFFRSPFLKEALDRELQEIAKDEGVAPTTVRRQFEKLLHEIVTRGIARTTGSLTPGINGFSAPVYDHGGRMVAAITALGAVGDFNVEWDNPIARAMMDSATELSRRLGYGSTRLDETVKEAGLLAGAPGRNRTNT